MQNFRPIRCALLSVSDKTGIIDFAKSLIQLNVKLLSTGGTAKLLIKNNIPVFEVSDYTGFPEMMDGRLKTLHPKVHGGILGRRGIDDEMMKKYSIESIDMVVVNLYPFAKTTQTPNCTLHDAIENIDIGGPTMIRSAAKNHQDVAVVVDHNDYDSILSEMRLNQSSVSFEYRFSLAVKAFEHTASYDGMIANYFGRNLPPYGMSTDTIDNIFPRTINLQFIKKATIRYGENAHQKAAFYIEEEKADACVSSAKQLQGKALSFNNIADADTALECAKSFEEPACVIVKHANPCGVAMADSILNAYKRAFKTDPTSAFGGIIAFNRSLDKETAVSILESQFVEVIIAPSITAEARAVLSTKNNIRVLECGEWQSTIAPRLDFKRVNGGLLVQEHDLAMVNKEELVVVTKRKPSQKELSDSLFCWKVAKFVKSNAIVYAKDNMTIGIGAGQMSRVYSAKIASIKAQDEKLDISGSVVASDAFFPFRDGVDTAAAAGVTCIIQPGGSIRDEEVIQAANEHNLVMIFTQMRHFRH